MTQPCLGAPTRYLNFVADSAYDLLVSQGSPVRISQVEAAVQLRARELGPHVLTARASQEFRAYCLNAEVLGRVGDCIPSPLRTRLMTTSLHDFSIVGRGTVRGFDFFEFLKALVTSQLDSQVSIPLEHPHLRSRVPEAMRHELIPAMGVRSVAFSFDRRYLREWRQLDVTSKFDLICRLKRSLIDEASRRGPLLEVLQIGGTPSRTFPLLEGAAPGLWKPFEGCFSPPTSTVTRVRQLEVTAWRFHWLGAAVCFCLTVTTLWALVHRIRSEHPSQLC